MRNDVANLVRDFLQEKKCHRLGLFQHEFLEAKNNTHENFIHSTYIV